MRTLLSIVALSFSLLVFNMTSLSAQTAGGGLSLSQKDDVRQIVRDVLLENPEIILEALDLLREKQEQDTLDKEKNMITQNKTLLFSNPGDPVLGNTDGDIVVVEFSDYQCGYCKKIFEPLKALLVSNPRIRLVIKEFPILGPTSVSAAKYALAAQKQGKYEAFHDILMTTRGPLTDQTITETLVKVGVNLDQAKKDAASKEILAAIDATKTLGEALFVRGTPAFVVGDTVIGGADLDGLVAAITEVTKAKKHP